MNNFSNVIILLFVLFSSCKKEQTNKITELKNENARIFVNCETRGSFEYLINIDNENYFPLNLPDSFKNTIFNNMPIFINGIILDSLVQIYEPGPDDGPIPTYKAKVLKISNINFNCLPVDFVSDFGMCYPITNMKKSYVVNNFESYKDFQDSVKNKYNENCNNLSEIDFNNFTFIGFYTGVNCSATYSRKVFDDFENKKNVYTIIIHQKGICKLLVSSMNWALIPKLPKDYTLEFRTLELKE